MMAKRPFVSLGHMPIIPLFSFIRTAGGLSPIREDHREANGGIKTGPDEDCRLYVILAAPKDLAGPW